MKHSYTLAEFPGATFNMVWSVSTEQFKYYCNELIKRIIVVCSIFGATTINAQTVAEGNRHFLMPQPISKVLNSYFNQIEFLDSRPDTVTIGNIIVGMTNRREEATASEAMEKQIKQVFNALIDRSAKSGTVLFQLRMLSFNEILKPALVERKCRIRARMYRKNVDKYIPLGNLDTLVSVSTLNSRNRFYKDCGNIIIDFIGRNLKVSLSSRLPLDRHEIINIDSVEMSKINVYAMQRLNDGVYNNYQSFKRQIPDYRQVEGEVNNGLLKITKVLDDKGKKVKWRKAYAVIYAGNPYILTNVGNFLLLKTRIGYCFNGPVKLVTGPSNGDYIAPMFGLAGVLVHSLQTKEYETLHLDHLTGDINLRYTNNHP